jgi:hypothetical protein
MMHSLASRLCRSEGYGNNQRKVVSANNGKDAVQKEGEKTALWSRAAVNRRQGKWVSCVGKEVIEYMRRLARNGGERRGR